VQASGHAEPQKFLENGQCQKKTRVNVTQRGGGILVSAGGGVASLLHGPVEVQCDFLEKITRAKPVQALGEFIWNSLDADTSAVDVFFEDNELGVLSRIIVLDNGTGMERVRAPELFGSLGGSLRRPGATFYILDNSLRDDRFAAVLTLFDQAGISTATGAPGRRCRRAYASAWRRSDTSPISSWTAK
jgi:hypothetical protein